MNRTREEPCSRVGRAPRATTRRTHAWGTLRSFRAGAVMVVAVLALGAAPAARAQCLLANPSFELTGTGTTFAGWNQFGPTGSSSEAFHGHRAARVTGPNAGLTDVSGFWQGLDTAPLWYHASSVTAVTVAVFVNRQDAIDHWHGAHEDI